MTTLSIIILSHNGIAHTLRCLKSLDGVMRKHDDYKVIVVDNGSATDVKSEIDKLPFDWHDRLKVLRSDVNLGVAGGRNLGMRAMGETKYFMFLDNDTVVPEGSLETLVNYMDSHPQTGLVAPCLVSPQGQIQLSYKPFPGIFQKMRNLVTKKCIVAVPSEESTLEPFYVIGASQLIRASLIDRVGYLDDNIFFGPEDADYCIRIRKEGFKVEYLKDVKIVHDWQRASRRSLLSDISRRHIKGCLYFYRKWHRWV